MVPSGSQWTTITMRMAHARRRSISRSLVDVLTGRLARLDAAGGYLCSRLKAMARTAFVTGGTGFVGRHVVEQLTALGWHVVALHRPTSDVTHLKAYGAELAVGSITDAASLARAMPERCDAVFHVAGNTSLWSGGDAQQTRENVDGTRFVVETAIARKARRLVHTSTEAAWGEQHGVFDETAKSNAPESPVN